MQDPNYWSNLWQDYQTAAKQTGLGLSGDNALLLACSVAEHETNNSRAWPGTNNFGAVQLRGLTADELARFKAGTLKAGDQFSGNPGGVLHVDTHPPGIPYPVWFVAFDTRVAGIAYFLKMLWRLSSNAPDQAGCTPMMLAQAMYMHGYYEGAHPGARPPWKRNLPLLPPEQANVNDYGGAVARCFQSISSALGISITVEADPIVTDKSIAASS